MRNNVLQQDQQLKKDYIKAFYNFEEKYIPNIYKNYNITNMRFGYLIDLNKYNEIKDMIHYEKNKKNISNDKNKLVFPISKKIFEVEKIEFDTPQYLIDMIYNNNKYILIDQELWKILCKKGKENENPITYNIKLNDIILTLKKEKLKFTQ